MVLVCMLGEAVWAGNTEPRPSYSWDGGYVGMALGGSKNIADTLTTLKRGYFNAQDASQLNPMISQVREEVSLTGSLLAGVNYQINDFIVGIETDIILTQTNAEQDLNHVVYDSQPAHTFDLHQKVSSDWMVSLRPRIGYAVDTSLIYVTAGVTYSEFRYEFSFSDTFDLRAHTAANSSHKRFGWVVGGGYEIALKDAWRIKAEYIHYEFNTVSGGMEASLQGGLDQDGFKIGIDDFRVDIFRIGLVFGF